MKIKELYNIYAQSYLKLTNSDKYHAYHELYLTLNSELKKIENIKNILFINQTQNDISYLTFLSDEHKQYNLFMSGIKLDAFSIKYYYEEIDNVFDNYDFFNFNYQPKFNKENWKTLKKNTDKIDLIILPCKIVDKDNIGYFENKKLIKFLQLFKKAKIIGIGYDFSLTNQTIKKRNFNTIKLNEFISIKTRK